MKTLVTAFARANIFHQGHIVLVEEVNKIAMQVNGDAAVFLSHTENKKNPLPYDFKVVLMNKWTNGTVKLDNENKVKMIGNLLHYANEGKYTNVIIVCGSDRAEEYSKSLPEFAASRDYFNFDSVTVRSLIRDTNKKDISGMSGTLMRSYIKEDNFDSFRRALPLICTNEEAESIWLMARKVK